MHGGQAAVLSALRAPDAAAGEVRAAVTALLELDPLVGVSAVFDLLSTEPRIKPSRRLVIDPTDDARRRWDCRVAAAAALLESPHAARVAHELADELAADADLAADVMAIASPHSSIRRPDNS